MSYNNFNKKFVFKKFLAKLDDPVKIKLLRTIEQSHPLHYQEEQILVKTYQDPNTPDADKTKALQTLILTNLQFMSIAVRMAVPYLNGDEFYMLLNDMVIDFVKAVDCFDTKKDTGRLTLWGFCGKILRMRCQDHHLTFKKPLHGDLHTYALSHKVTKEESAIGKELSITDISKKYNCGIGRARRSKEWMLSYVSVSNIQDKDSTHQESIEVKLTHQRVDQSLNIYTPAELLERKDSEAHLRTIVKSILTPKEFRSIDLYYFRHMHYKQIAEVLGITEKKVDNDISRAIGRLRNNKKLIKDEIN